MEDILYSQNNKFRAHSTSTGTAWATTAICSRSGRAGERRGGQAVLNAYADLLLKRGDVNSSGTTECGRCRGPVRQFRAGDWLYDMNVDGTVNIADVSTMITEVFRTMPGDFNLDGTVDAGDYVVWRDSRRRRHAYSRRAMPIWTATWTPTTLRCGEATLVCPSAVDARRGKQCRIAAVPESSTLALAALRVDNAWNDSGDTAVV